MGGPNRYEDGQRHQLGKYGLTIDTYNKMLAEQAGVCAICKGQETVRGRGGKLKKLSVDHCHTTNAVRGLLCHYCNVGIGYLKDDPEILRAAHKYLEKGEVDG